MSKEFYIGLMSGTSLDGVDAVLTEFECNKWHKVIAHAYLPFDQAIKQDILALQEIGLNELHRSQILAQQLSHLYAKLIKKLLTISKMSPSDIQAIGCHGQTIRHNPDEHYSIQLADWSLLAELTAITVIGDFRMTDIAAGGQGAPLVPAFHHHLFHSDKHQRVVCNIGGISNITILSKDNSILGFDTGPGNMLMDAWMQKNWQQHYDENGQKARLGIIIPPLLAALTAHDYFKTPPPKSTGRDLFSISWLEDHLQGNEKLEDVMRTLLEFTVSTLAQAILEYASETEEIYLCGGGADNLFLGEELQLKLPQIHITTTSALGLPPQQVESAAFAWLAFCRLKGVYANLPYVTGAHGYRLLGAIWHSK